MSEPETKNRETVQAIWTRRLFALSLVLLGTTFLLQGVGVLRFPEHEPAKAKQKPVRAGGLRCDEPVWDFGSVDSVKSPRLTHEFVLVNESKETVTIKKIHSTCGCMVAEGYDKELTPGGSTKLRVDVQLPPTPGDFNKNLAVQTSESVVPLRVVGEIMANSSLFSTPAIINFGVIKSGELKERTVKVFRRDGSPVDFLEAFASWEGVRINTTICSVSVVEIKVSLDTVPSAGVGTIFISTNNSQSPSCDIPVLAKRSNAND